MKAKYIAYNAIKSCEPGETNNVRFNELKKLFDEKLKVFEENCNSTEGKCKKKLENSYLNLQSLSASDK